MHAVLGVSKIHAAKGSDAEALAKGILGQLSQAPGFISGTFTRSPDGKEGRSMILFESADAAKAAAAGAKDRLPADAPIELVSLDIYEVVAHG